MTDAGEPRGKSPAVPPGARQPEANVSTGAGNDSLELYTKAELDEAVRRALAKERRQYELRCQRMAALLSAYRGALDRVCREYAAFLLGTDRKRYEEVLRLQSEVGRQLDANVDAQAVLELFAVFDRLNRDDYAAIMRGEVPPHITALLKKLLPSDD